MTMNSCKLIHTGIGHEKHKSTKGRMEITCIVSFALFVLCVSLPSTANAQYVCPPGKTLRELAEARGFHIGANFPNLYGYWCEEGKSGSRRFDPEAAIAKDNFTIMNAGWEVFPGHTWEGEGQYDFDGTDHYIKWCEQNGIRFHGHGIGYVFRAGWPFKDLPVETEAEKARVREIYEQYVRDTVSHFKGRVHMWDVCNEHLYPPYQSGGWLMWNAEDGARSYWRAYDMDPRDAAGGYDWYAKTLTIAHEVDPDAKLVLLDFNNEIVCPKSDTMYALAKTLLAKGLPLHGIGFQMHINTQCNREKWKNGPERRKQHDLSDDEYFDSMRKNIKRFTDLGLDVWITELSVDLDPDKPHDEELKRQAEVYRRVLEVGLENPGFKGIKLWGVVDDMDWQADKPFHPYLFDAEGRAKPAFFAVQDTLENYWPETTPKKEKSDATKKNQ